MKAQKFLTCLGLILSVLGLVACKQADHSFSSENSIEAASTAQTDSTDPVSGDPAVRPLPKTSLSCGLFINSPVEIDTTATTDADIIGTSASMVISKPLRNISVQSKAGPIDIRSAVRATLVADSGMIRLNAQTIPSVFVGSGTICVRADHIGDINATGASGAQTIIANTVDSLALGNAIIHIYNAKVKTLVGKSEGSRGSAHQICLHNGAQILNFGGYNQDVVSTNCDPNL